jgi:hypothetical protein
VIFNGVQDTLTYIRNSFSKLITTNETYFFEKGEEPDFIVVFPLANMLAVFLWAFGRKQ